MGSLQYCRQRRTDCKAIEAVSNWPILGTVVTVLGTVVTIQGMVGDQPTVGG